MPCDRRIERLLEDLRRLAAQDARLEVFGARSHGYRLNHVLPLARIRALEDRRSVQLPSDYVLFLTKMGNGGAGPFYGVNPLGERDSDTGDETRSWWSGDPLIGDLTRPFPHTAAWNLSESAIARGRAGTGTGRRRCHPVARRLRAQRLIIAGPERGHDALGTSAAGPWMVGGRGNSSGTQRGVCSPLRDRRDGGARSGWENGAGLPQKHREYRASAGLPLPACAGAPSLRWGSRI
jgi:hypothetical protein